jgi:hypothetical protein
MRKVIQSKGVDLFKEGVETTSEGEEAFLVPGAGAEGQGVEGRVPSVGQG